MRFHPKVALFLVILMTAASACSVLTKVSQGNPISPTQAPPADLASPTPYQFSGQPLQLAWFYRPPEDDNLGPLINQFSYFILTKTDEPVRDALRAAGVQAPILQYLLLMEIMDPRSCTAEPYHDQVADQVGDYCWIVEQHPDWFLSDQSGKPIRNDGTVFMDPGNPDYREFWLTRAQQMQQELGWYGIFIDNVEASLGAREKLGPLPARYPSDASFEAAVEGFLEYVYTNIAGQSRPPILANIINVKDPNVWFRYLKYLDGVMVERFAVDWEDGYLSADEWSAQMELVSQAQQMGKTVILVSQGSKYDTNREQFALASYLLVNEGQAYFRYTHSTMYRNAWIYSNFALNLGTPLGPRLQVGKTWQRIFSHGKVTVDPSKHQAYIETSP